MNRIVIGILRFAKLDCKTCIALAKLKSCRSKAIRRYLMVHSR